MTSLMARGQALLARTAPVVAGGEICYRRGELEAWFSAGFGKTEYEVEVSGQVRIEHTDRDFIFERSLLVLGGEPVTPERGDRITVVDADTLVEEVYEVLAPSGQKVYRLNGQIMRVHSKKVGNGNG